MKRPEQIVLITTFVCFSWLAMPACDELGHVLGAWATGAEVKRVALHPLVSAALLAVTVAAELLLGGR